MISWEFYTYNLDGDSMRELSYDPLWKKPVEMKIKKSELAEKAGISKNTVTKMFKNEYSLGKH